MRKLNRPQKQMVEHLCVEIQSPRTPGQVAAAVHSVPDEPGAVIAIIRGGGSAADLAWLSDDAVVSAIVSARVPVFTAIGHEPDWTEADRVATASMMTPTDLANALRQAQYQQWARQNRNYSGVRAGIGKPSERLNDTSAKAQSTPINPLGSSLRPKPPSPPVAGNTVPAFSRVAPPAQRPVFVQPYEPAYRSSPRKNSLGTASFWLGLVSIVVSLFGITPLIGLIFGIVAVRRQPRGMAVAGIVINAVILTLIFILIALFIVGRAAMAARHQT